MKEQNEEKNLEIGGVITRTEQYLQKNKKALIIIVCAIAVIGLGIWAYIELVNKPHQRTATEEMYAAEQWFNEGAFEKALNGDDQYLGFVSIIDEYGSTKAGNLAKLYAGICQLNLGQYEEALDNLKSYHGKDAITPAETDMLIGDAYAELGDNAEAARYYEKAAKEADNFITTPTALWKAGMMYLALENNEMAAEKFHAIKDKYPESSEWSEVDKWISFAETGKME